MGNIKFKCNDLCARKSLLWSVSTSVPRERKLLGGVICTNTT